MHQARRPPKDPLDHDPDAVRAAREAAGLTRTALAREVGVSLSLMSEIESGTRNCTPERMAEIARVLGVDPDLLARSPRVVPCPRCEGVGRVLEPRQEVSAA
ncbi:hypothetical protein GCM10027160_24170 [Streptomyces calidiresistens]|uniref:Helix-turn-helix domain-containing protein n=1 Tax=Streptomyces calidiresistens TaxID=1485586 RepID=A0A7W3XZ13_9ACTN|nr:helix-turn-helix transcriptional regulator [Streptomyces calidiresistens]MBB0232523.1 helix-turn-helix domain-containing protein [Streptomyces calidiresistens]